MLRSRSHGPDPAAVADGTLWRRVPVSRTVDTATGLADKTVYHFAAFVRDTSGNWSAQAAGARDTARTPDVTPPANVTGLVATAASAATLNLAWTAPASADADSVMIRYRAGGPFPTSTADGTLWKTVPIAQVSEAITGLTGNTVYAVGLFARDSSGNFAAAAAGAQDSALWQAPVTGAIAIADQAGATRDADPAAAFAWSGADSLRFSLLADTGIAAWEGVRANDSVNVAAGPDGKRILAVQYKNVFGTRSPWYRDTTLLDRAGPALTLNLPAAASYLTWPNLVAGMAKDSLAGTDTVFVLRNRESDNAWFNGSGWGGVPDTARLRADSAFSVPLTASALASGYYNFAAWGKDKLGNASAAATIRVRYDANRAPVLASDNLADSVPQNQPIAWTLDLGDLDLGDTVRTVTATIPSWIAKTETPDTARNGFAAHRVYALSGKPGQADVGPHTLSVQARDVGGQTFLFSKTIQVVDVNDAPAFAPGQDTLSAKEDAVTRFVPHFLDPDPGDKPVLALVSGPAWASLADSTLTLAPGSRDVGQAQVRLTVSDGKLLDTLDMLLTVVNVNDAPVAFPAGVWPPEMLWNEDVADTFSVVVVDMDKGECVSLAGALPAFLAYQASIDASGYNRTFRFTARHGQARRSTTSCGSARSAD
jgi:hypothetical protein